MRNICCVTGSRTQQLLVMCVCVQHIEQVHEYNSSIVISIWVAAYLHHCTSISAYWHCRCSDTVCCWSISINEGPPRRSLSYWGMRTRLLKQCVPLSLPVDISIALTEWSLQWLVLLIGHYKILWLIDHWQLQNCMSSHSNSIKFICTIQKTLMYVCMYVCISAAY